MAFYEQLIIGQGEMGSGQLHDVLSRSPGVSQDVCEEIQRICRDWGDIPPLGLERPALISLPLQNRASSIRGRLHVVIRVAPGHDTLFHAVILSGTDFGGFLWNPYKLQEKGIFRDTALEGAILPRERVEPDPSPVRVTPQPSGSDQGVIDEALSQFLSAGRLSLPLEQPDKFSDRAFCLLVSLIPPTARQDLKFASFATRATNNFMLAGMEASGASFAGWHRLLVSQMGGALSPVSEKYVAQVRQGLQLGSLAQIYEGHRPSGTDNVASVGAGSAPVAAARTAPAGAKPMSRKKNIPPEPTRTHRRDKPAHLSRLTRQPLPVGSHSGAGVRPFLMAVLILAVVGCVGWGYFMGIPDQIKFFRTGGRNLQAERRATSLLEVVDVGEIHAAQLKKVTRAGFVPGLDRDLVRGQAQAALQAEAAGPLLKQADLFLDLAGQGIQQGRRPDRETARMSTLAQQGAVLQSELFRLELAWHSLDQDVCWQDLATLADSQVKARRDSLAAADKAALAASQTALGTTDYWRPLQAASRQVDGMHALLALFQRPAWSAKWEKDLYRAAELVSPSASPVTRAYRNSAFTVVRLKRAERMAGSVALPFVTDLAAAESPAPEVLDVLPSLRRQAGKFAGGEAPDLLVGLLSLYQVFADDGLTAQAPTAAFKRIKGLRGNYAYKFDPQVYDSYLDRLVFEVFHQALATGTLPEQLPEGAFGAADRAAALDFHAALEQNPAYVDWDSLSRRNEGTFVGRWSHHLAQANQAQVATRVVEGDASWRECRQLLANLERRVAVGADWTSVWVDLHQELTRANSLHRGWSSGDPLRRDRIGQLNALTLHLEEARPLPLQTVTVRLAQEVLEAPAQVVLEFQSDAGGQVHRSESFSIGPAAPEGSGWVGTGTVGVQVNLSPVEAFTGRIRSAASGEVLLEVAYPALSDRVGPGGLTRPRPTEAGSLQFQTGDQWWRNLQLPSLEDASGSI